MRIYRRGSGLPLRTALIIPAYKPGEDMLKLLEEFRNNGDFLPVVVDDGSGAEFRAIFDRVPDYAVLLRHEVNRGKGAALKTAMKYVLESLPECDLALTADADGQHKYADILRVNQVARENPGALVLGSRKFEGDVPFKSRWGNAITRQVFAIASGAKVYDTQTGLRAFGREAMEQFLQISGDRYEYEINMLLAAAQSGRPIVEEWIATVYIDDNSSSHFHPVRDSFKIYMCILKFGCSSLIAFGVDFVMLLILSALTAGLGAELSLAVSAVGARLVSASVNFCINRRVVFKGNETLGKAIAKYAALALCILVVNYLLLRLLNLVLKWPLALSKIIVEALLFVLSFVVQGKFVYRGKGTKGK